MFDCPPSLYHREAHLHISRNFRRIPQRGLPFEFTVILQIRLPLQKDSSDRASYLYYLDETTITSQKNQVHSHHKFKDPTHRIDNTDFNIPPRNIKTVLQTYGQPQIRQSQSPHPWKIQPDVSNSHPHQSSTDQTRHPKTPASSTSSSAVSAKQVPSKCPASPLHLYWHPHSSSLSSSFSSSSFSVVPLPLPPLFLPLRHQKPTTTRTKSSSSSLN